MMARLVSRFGVNMTATEVENELVKIERKSGEDLYSLADRIRTLANRAHLPEARKTSRDATDVLHSAEGQQWNAALGKYVWPIE